MTALMSFILLIINKIKNNSSSHQESLSFSIAVSVIVK